MSGPEELSLFDAAPTHTCNSPLCNICHPRKVDPAKAALKFATDWRVKANAWFDELPRGRLFTSEDVTDAIGYPGGDQGMNRNNAVGGWVQSLSRKGVIANVGTQASLHDRSNGARIVVWEKT